MNPRLGLILMFEGDIRKVHAAIKNVTSFSAVSAVLKNGDNDVTSLYIDTLPSSKGNILISDKIGGKASIPAGNYRYFIHGTYGGKKRTWFWDVLVLPHDLSLLSGMDMPLEDYNPLVEEITIHEGDNFARQMVVPDVEFTAASAKLRLLAQDVTSDYCVGTPLPNGDTITTHNIGGFASIPAGDYGYFVTGTYNDDDCQSTWFYKIKVLPKQGVLP
jgi:hypothetical protein